jgi:hypothetical protein
VNPRQLASFILRLAMGRWYNDATAMPTMPGIASLMNRFRR